MKKILKRRISQIDHGQFDDGTHPLLQHIYQLRGINSSNALTRSISALTTFETLTGISTAVAVLYQAITEQQHILVVGDFDADGATSTALIVKALRALGISNVNYLVPDRFADGYGLSENVVKHAMQVPTQLIITVDNGISSFEGVRLAKKHGIKVIITDHHLPSHVLPEADAIINPNLPNCAFPSKSLAGVGVAFYFMLAFRAHLRKQNWFTLQGITELNMATLLDLVALGTVADVVTLDRNNRILVYQGICRIRHGLGSIGINTLIKISNKQSDKLTASDLGYLLAPRLNAAGRMENMAIGVELLLSENAVEAMEIAKELDALNNERRNIEQTMQLEAMGFIKQIESSLQEIPHGIVIFHPDWHQGVIGILSARIKDRYYRPVISFATAGNEILKGSGRSIIPGFHLRDALERIDTSNPGLIACFGGHAMAAGLTIAKKNIQKFEHCFAKIAREMLDDNLLNHIILSDGELASEWVNYDVANLIKEGGPWGQGFPEPLFDGDFYLHQQRIVGDKHLNVVVQSCSGGPLLEGIAFNVDKLDWPDQSIKQIKLAYHLDINEFRGQKKLQLLIRHLWVTG